MVSRKTIFAAAAPAFLGFALLGCGGKEEGSGGSAGGTSASGSSAEATAKVDPATAGTIRVKVKFEGTPPPMEATDMSGDPVCKEHNPKGEIPNPVIVNADGTLANCFVYIKDGLKGSFPAPAEKVVFDQKNCSYNPHVFGIQVGQPLEIVNSDPTLHNVHTLAKKNTNFNEGQPKQGDKMTKKFKVAEVMVPIKCDVHGWMKAYAGVVAHPYYGVTAEKGTVELKDVPPGEYTIEIWHEKYGTKTEKVTLGAKETKAVEVTFKAQS
jgi:plastocyanin